MSQRAAPFREVLPVDSALPEILEALERSSNLVIEAPPGTGKTTRVPPALLEAGFVKRAGSRSQVWVLEPRRLAAKLSAERVAEEGGEEVGRRIGYQFRFERRDSEDTRVLFLTEGMLTRRMLGNPTLDGVAAVILDEFHERHLQTDLSFVLLRRLQQEKRPDLRLIVMSATLDAERLAVALGGAPRVRVEGRRFDVSAEYLPQPDPRPIEVLVRDAVRSLRADSRATGHALVFLPGLGEIERCAAYVRESGAWGAPGERGFEIHRLHGEIPREEQDRAIRKSAPGVRKLILSTNVAESSLTVDGVDAVIDSGLARVAGFSPWSGLPSLRTRAISRASGTQRAGRAGRQKNGVCLRLYARGEWDGRAPFETPEILRTDLAQPMLELLALGVTDPLSLPWLDPPEKGAVEGSLELLRLLGAIQPGWKSGAPARITPQGSRLARFPLHPRLGKLVIEGLLRGCGDGAIELAAAISEGGFPGLPSVGESADLLEHWEAWRRRAGGRATGSFERIVSRIRGATRSSGEEGGGAGGRDEKPLGETAELLRPALLSAFPDRVARRQEAGGTFKLLLCNGRQAELADEALAHSAEWFLALEAREVRGQGQARSRVIADTVVPIEPELLLELDPARSLLEEKREMIWNPRQERVDERDRLAYGILSLSDDVRAPSDPQAAARLLVDQLLSGPEDRWARVLELEPLRRLRERIEFVREFGPRAGLSEADLQTLPQLFAPRFQEWAAEQAARLGAIRAVDLRELAGGVVGWVEAALREHSLGARLDELAPDAMPLGGRRSCPIHYAAGKPPWVESRIQDFFGTSRTPRLLGGRIPLTVHLLAPNQRAVQVTQDLEGFWKNGYAELKRELSRNYPRHHWPEDPSTAQPTHAGLKPRH